jgi:hypothetical protein
MPANIKVAMIRHATREKGQQHLVLQRQQSYTVQHKSTNAPTVETAEGTVEEQLQESVDCNSDPKAGFF